MLMIEVYWLLACKLVKLNPFKHLKTADNCTLRVTDIGAHPGPHSLVQYYITVAYCYFGILFRLLNVAWDTALQSH